MRHPFESFFALSTQTNLEIPIFREQERQVAILKIPPLAYLNVNYCHSTFFSNFFIFPTSFGRKIAHQLALAYDFFRGVQADSSIMKQKP